MSLWFALGAVVGSSLVPVGASGAAEEERAPDAEALQEIVVTANRRPERLARVPLSVSVLDGADLVERGVESTRDLNSLAPNLSVQPGVVNGGAALFGIRGIISSGDESLGFESPVGLYIDGVPITRSAASTFDLTDVARIEVLRGPQGTLFGRNTTGGAINLVLAEPRERRRFRAGLELGSGNLFAPTVSVDSGRVGVARFHLAGRWRQQDGFVDNLLEPRSAWDPGGARQWALRGTILMDGLEGWRVKAAADWSRVRSAPWAGQVAAVGDGTPLPPLQIGGANVPVVQPAPVGPWLSASVPLDPRCPPIVTAVRRGRLCLADRGRSEDRFWGGSLRLERALGSLTFRSTTALRQWRNRNQLFDIDGLPRVRGPALTSGTVLAGIPQSTLGLIPGLTPEVVAALSQTAVPTTTAPVFAASNDRGTRQWSQELDLRSAEDAPIQWVVGAFAHVEHGWDTNVQQIGAVVDVAQSILVPTFGPLAPALIAGLPAGTRYRLSERVVTLDYDVRNSSYAVFGQVSGQFAGSIFGYAAGARLTHDARRIERRQNGVVPFSAQELAANDKVISFTEPSGHLTVTAKPSRSLNVWLRLAEGYQAGGWNARQATRLPTAQLNGIDLAPYKPEKLTSLELGARWLHGTTLVNGAIYGHRYRNRLVSIPIPDAPTFGTLIANGARSSAWGLEVDGSTRLADWLSLTAAAGYNRSRFSRFPGTEATGAPVNIASVVKDANSPRFTGSASLVGTWSLEQAMTIEARASWTGTSRRTFFSDPTRLPLAPQLTAKPAHRFGASIALKNVAMGDALFDARIWVSGLGKQRPVRGVDLGQLGLATLIFSEPWQAGFTLTSVIE